MMPHHRGTNLNLKIWTLCSILLLIYVPRPPRILTNLVGLLTLLTFSKWLQLDRGRSEYAHYARKSVSPANKLLIIILVTNMATRKFQMRYKTICTRSTLENQIVVNTSSPIMGPSMIRPFK